MKLIITFMTIMFASTLFGQTVEFTYDNAGNRTTRIIVTLAPPPDIKPINDSTTMDDPKRDNTANIKPIVDSVGLGVYKIFPNPTTSKITVDLGNNFSLQKNQVVELLDLQGKSIKSYEVTQHEVETDFTSLSSGTYIIRFNSDNVTIKTWKVLRE